MINTTPLRVHISTFFVEKIHNTLLPSKEVHVLFDNPKQ